jgi:hypothetical protein
VPQQEEVSKVEHPPAEEEGEEEVPPSLGEAAVVVVEKEAWPSILRLMIYQSEISC